MVALHWICSDARRWGLYVKNRITEIQELTSADSWRHCSGSDNPADLPSRGTSAGLLNSNLWLHGPEWLQRDTATWPKTLSCEAEPTECRTEEKKQVLPAVSSRGCPVVEELLNLANYSSLSRLLKVTAWIRRWVHNCRAELRRCGPLSAEEI